MGGGKEGGSCMLGSTGVGWGRPQDGRGSEQRFETVRERERESKLCREETGQVCGRVDVGRPVLHHD